MTPRALTIAGSDSGGCAGIQADIKTFSALGVFGMSAVTALTSQNTLGVTNVSPVSAENVISQIDAVMSDIGANAVKTGMLFSKDIIKAVAERLKYWRADNLVVDPVMVSATGAVLLQDDAMEEMVHSLFPLAKVVTPNLPEAETLIGGKIKTDADCREACKTLVRKGVKSVVLKGGHIGSVNGKAVDLCYNGNTFYELLSEWSDTKNLHGTGCTFSAAIAGFLALAYTTEESLKLAKKYISGAVSAGKNMSIGSGGGPVDHFWQYNIRNDL
ncbi:MAG: bifunctional hydroxymethylpyrimidine kinase/phosphomethylpyrimidine kinase [Deferribacteraceae bacterium]|jgi:hydroxymethylpyrimidine/phosphomethylpyrimidine kinase|nr:bifunctional hydroxymethylpyrimidine kinase/phosphomethylpyrimidine kinase [Deferribacteraceae bacterium]